MKKSTKFISLILAIVMVFSTLSIAASAAAINSKYNTVEKLIQMDSINDLLNYLVTNINNQKDILITPVLRIVFLAMNNEDINGYIGSKEVTQLSGAEGSKVLVQWLDNKILPDLQANLEGNSILDTINNLGITVKVGSVQDVFDTLRQLDSPAGKIALAALGDASSLDVSAISAVSRVAGNEYNAVKAVVQFLKDNIGIVQKLLQGNLNLGISALTNLVKDKIGFIGQLPQLIKSFLYKLIDKDAAAGEFADGKMGGDWANSAYKDFNADQLLAAALIKLINKADSVTKAEADELLGKSFYGILTQYAPVLYKNFAVDWLNDNLQGLIDKVPAEARGEFVATMPTFDENTFASIFNGAGEAGFLGQLNNILVRIAELILAPATYNKIGLEKGGNDKLNANLTKFCQYVLPILYKIEDQIGYTFPEDMKAKDASTLTLPEMAIYILKPFFGTWFGGNDKFDSAAVEAADTLQDLAVLAVYYTATNTDWLTLDYTFKPVTADTLADLSEDAATDLALEIGAGIAIGAIKHNAETIHFTANLDESSWQKAFIGIENWALDFVSGLPAVARVHNLRAADSYGPFYKLNVLLNELINFSFLNGVNDATFKLDVETLLKDGLVKNLYNFDLAAIVGIFEKNSAADNILAKQFNSSVIDVVNRILTALFEHDCGTHATKTTTEDDPKNPCTQQIKKEYEYCTVCGAYFKYVPTTITKGAATHAYGEYETIVTATGLTPTLATCTQKTQQQRTCTICGYVDKKPETTASHTWDDPKAADPRCTVCGKSVSELKGGNPPQPPVADYELGDVDGKDGITAGDARLALRRAVNLETYAEGTPEFLACDVDKDGKVTASDARVILRVAVKLESIDAYKNK